MIAKHARRLERLEHDYRSQLTEQLAHARGIVERVPSGGRGALGPAVAAWRGAAAGSRQSTVGYRDSVRGTRQQSASQVVNGACDDLLVVLDRVVEDTDKIVSYCDWVSAGGSP